MWWSGGGSNSRPSHCERDALPAELPPRYSSLTFNKSWYTLVKASGDQCVSFITGAFNVLSVIECTYG